MCADVLLKRDSVTRFFVSGFFHESSSPKPLKITVGPFQIFWKIRRDIGKSKYINGINDTVNFPTGTAGVVDTGGKFGEEDSPQLRSANLQTYKICSVCKPSASVAICRFVICGPNIFRNLQICDLRS
jgi:hypothetical protein